MSLELRMYGLVPYNISPIQQSIQFGHAVVEYGLENFQDDMYQDWAKNYKTFIILNGGTTNTNPNCLGTLNLHVETLKNMGIKTAKFYEPDLGDQLTAVVFILDERVFDKKKYPDYITNYSLPLIDSDVRDYIQDGNYNKWKTQFNDTEDNIEKIIELRKFISDFRLA